MPKTWELRMDTTVVNEHSFFAEGFVLKKAAKGLFWKL